MEWIGYIFLPILLKNAVSRKWTKRHLEVGLFRVRRSDSSASERSFGKGGVDEGVTWVIELGISGKIIAKLHSVGNEIENPIRSRIVLYRGKIRTERGVHGIHRTSHGIENVPTGSCTGHVLNHEILRLESEIHERAVRTSIANVRSELRETGNLGPKVGDVVFSTDVVIEGLIRMENRRIGNSAETPGTVERCRSMVKPGTPGSIRGRRPRLVDGRVVGRPVVVPLGVIVPIEVFREIHRRFRTERMTNLTSVRTVAGIRYDIESGDGAFFPVPCHERPSCLADVHVYRKSVRIERGQRRRGGFSNRRI